MPQFSIRSFLRVSFVLFALVPAGLAGWLMLQSNSQSVGELATKTLQDAANRGQSDVQAHLRLASKALDGLMPVDLGSPQNKQALAWVSDPALFAPMAIALTRMSRDLQFIYFTNATGEVHGIENTQEGFRFGGRTVIDNGAREVVLRQSDSPLKSEGASHSSPDAGRSWYDAALQNRTRVFSPVTIHPASKQLVVTLSQPVYDNSGAPAGVLGADLSLQALSGLLRAQNISPNAAAFVVNESGLMLASTADAQMFTGKGDKLLLRSVSQSASPMVSGGFATLEKQPISSAEKRSVDAGSVMRISLSEVPHFITRRDVGAGAGLRWALVIVAPESDFNTGVAEPLTLLMACIGALILVGVLATAFAAQHTERAFRHLEQSVDQLAAGVIPSSIVKTPAREFTHLSKTVQDSALQLAENNLEVISGPASVESGGQDVGELQNQLMVQATELAAARDLALTATRSKAAFLAVISHELRTPLNGVAGMSTLLANTTLNAEQRDYLQSLCISSNQLQAVVDEILEFSRTESGEVVLKMAPINVRDVLQEACRAVATAAHAKNLNLVMDIPGWVSRPGGRQAPWVILGDAGRLGQVLTHLVVNAVKFTNSGTVTVTATQSVAPGEPGLPMLDVRVVDTGPGIAADQMRHVFTAFTQLDASISRKHGGTGLGLATCKRLVELMGGRISVESELGKGSTFGFTALAPWAGRLADETLQVDLLLPGLGKSSLDEQKATILVVDDNLINLKVACAMLLKLGYNILTADGGREAVRCVANAVARGATIGAVLMDVHMPEVDGIQATEVIRAAHGAKAPPIIALTAGVSSEDRERCLDAGMVEYLTKPLQVAALARSLARWTGHQAGAGAAVAESVHDSRSRSGNEPKVTGAIPEFARFERFSDADMAMPSGLVDFDRLNDFKEFDDAQLSMTREVIGLLFSEVPLQMAAIERAIIRNDIGGLSSAAHSLRGAASNVGAVTVQHLCSVLERGTLEAQAVPSDAQGCLVALQIAWNKTRPLLENWR